MALAEIALFELPKRITSLSLGSGFSIYNFNGRDYMINYSKAGEPMLLGRVTSRLEPIGERFISRFIPESDLDPQERDDIKDKLAEYWL